jgi:hypothetical protein
MAMGVSRSVIFGESYRSRNSLTLQLNSITSSHPFATSASLAIGMYLYVRPSSKAA